MDNPGHITEEEVSKRFKYQYRKLLQGGDYEMADILNRFYATYIAEDGEDLDEAA